MKRKAIFKAGPKVLQSIVLKKKIPLIVGWYLTYRCNRDCSFCGLSQNPGDELGTKDVLTILQKLAKAGTQIIVFSGGEPLLREDIGLILQESAKAGIATGLTSNGSFITDKIDELKKVGHVKLSFEGPQRVHDEIRGEGSYAEIMAAVEALKKKGIDTIFNTTLCEQNIDYIDRIVSIAENMDLRVKFQPVSSAHTLGKDISPMVPEAKRLSEAMTQLRRMRKSHPVIANTDAGLEYLSAWPTPPPVKCLGNRMFLRLDPAGRSFFCTMQRDNFASKTILEDGATATIESLQMEPCSGCWCTSTLELNLFFSHGWKKPWQILRFFHR